MKRNRMLVTSALLVTSLSLSACYDDRPYRHGPPHHDRWDRDRHHDRDWNRDRGRDHRHDRDRDRDRDRGYRR